MEKTILILVFVLGLVKAVVIGNNDSEYSPPHPYKSTENIVTYSCPLKCDSEKEYFTVGVCPHCHNDFVANN